MIKKERKTRINKTSTSAMTMSEFVLPGDQPRIYYWQVIKPRQIKLRVWKTIYLNLATSIWMTGETLQIIITGLLSISIGPHPLMMEKISKESHLFQPSLGAPKISPTNWTLFLLPAESEYWHWNKLQARVNLYPTRQVLQANWIWQTNWMLMITAKRLWF